MRSEAKAAFLHRFVASLPQKRPTFAHRLTLVFLFGSTLCGNNGIETPT